MLTSIQTTFVLYVDVNTNYLRAVCWRQNKQPSCSMLTSIQTTFVLYVDVRTNNLRAVCWRQYKRPSCCMLTSIQTTFVLYVDVNTNDWSTTLSVQTVTKYDSQLATLHFCFSYRKVLFTWLHSGHRRPFQQWHEIANSDYSFRHSVAAVVFSLQFP